MKKRSLSFLVEILFVLVFVGINQINSSAQSWPFRNGDSSNTRNFQTVKPLLVGDKITAKKLLLPWEIQGFLLSGDVDGTGRISLVSSFQSPPSVAIYDPISLASRLIPISENPYTNDYVSPYNLLDTDGEPGLEILTVITPNSVPSYGEGVPTLYQVVSGKQNLVLNQFMGMVGEDQNGDGVWSGRESPELMFVDEKGKVKILAHIDAGHEDYKPRAINIYDVESGKIDAQFHMATPPTGISFFQDPSLGKYIFTAPLTPDNWIRVNGEKIIDSEGNYINVSEDLDGLTVSDKEAYDVCLKLETDSEQAYSLDLQWYLKRGEYMSGSSLISRTEDNRLVVISWDTMIRSYDAISPGGIHVYDLKTGEIVKEFYLGEEISFRDVLKINNSNTLYGFHLEEKSVTKFDLDEEGPSKTIDFNDEPTVTLSALGVADMDGDGSIEILIAKKKPEETVMFVYDENLVEKDSLNVPPFNQYCFADANLDGLPEIYMLDQINNKELTVVEYESSSFVSDYIKYD